MKMDQFLFTRLPLELQYKVLEQYYETPIEIKAAHRPYVGRDRWMLTFTTDLPAAPLLVSREFRSKSLDILDRKRNSVFIWSTFRFAESSLGCTQIPEHFLRLCSTISELVIER